MNAKTNLAIDCSDSVVPVPSELVKYQNRQSGTPAPGDRIPLDTPLHVAQRDMHVRDIVKWAHKHKCVDWNLFGYATAVRLPDGTLKLINGQHRMQLVKWLLPDVLEVPAHIIQTASDDYIGKLFADMNGGSQRRLTPEDLLWAEIIGQDTQALATQEWLEAAGLACGKVNNQNQNPSVSRHTFEACLNYSKPATITAVDLFNSTFKNRAKIDSQIVTGLTLLFSMADYQDYGDVGKRVGQEFRTWFQQLPMAGISIDDLHFNNLKSLGASSKWENGWVLGIVQKFATAMRNQNKGGLLLPVAPAKQLYQGKYHTPDISDYTD